MKLTEQLRVFGSEPDTGNAYHEAADRIDQLEAQIAENIASLEARIDQLESALFAVKDALEASEPAWSPRRW